MPSDPHCPKYWRLNASISRGRIRCGPIAFLTPRHHVDQVAADGLRASSIGRSDEHASDSAVAGLGRRAAVVWPVGVAIDSQPVPPPRTDPRAGPARSEAVARVSWTGRSRLALPLARHEAYEPGSVGLADAQHASDLAGREAPCSQRPNRAEQLLVFHELTSTECSGRKPGPTAEAITSSRGWFARPVRVWGVIAYVYTFVLPLLTWLANRTRCWQPAKRARSCPPCSSASARTALTPSRS